MEQFVGQILAVSFNFAPVGWFLCQGQILPISQYTALFALIGTFYGGDGIQNFALPNLQGRSIVGMGQGAGLSNYVIGQVGGSETQTLTISNMPAHSHSLNADNTPAKTPEPKAHLLGYLTGGGNLYTGYAEQPVQLSPSSIGNTGGNQPFGVLNPYLAMNYIIAYQGIFPSRS